MRKNFAQERMNTGGVAKDGSGMKYYTIYLAETDEIIAFGGARQCATMLGCKTMGCFHSLVSRAKSGKVKKYIVVEEKL